VNRVEVPDRTQAALLGLLHRLAGADDRRELSFIAVNEVHALVPYRQAALCLERRGVEALSGVVSPEDNAPYAQFLRALCRQLGPPEEGDEARVLRQFELSEALCEQWAQWLPPQVLLLPLQAARDRGWLLLARDEPWTPVELQPLTEFGRQLSLALRAHGVGGGRLASLAAPAAREGLDWRDRLSRPGTWVLLVLLALAFLPVRLSVLAPAELVAAAPEVIRSPLDGVVERVLVEPNERVTPGTPLFEFDRAAIAARLDVAERSLDTLAAEYRQRAQQALADGESRAALAVIAGRIEEQRAEVSYLRELADRGRVLAGMAGVVIFDDPAEWAGRPVVTGERVMLIADEHETEVEAWLAPDDLIALAPGAALRFYLNADPLRAVPARMRYLAYSATQRPDNSFAYRVRATLESPDEALRIGLKGTAKLSGERVSLWYYLLRKPLAALRGLVGL
jgi:multidrug efflux pump subunit AcrA (membrane-fusion protein)